MKEELGKQVKSLLDEGHIAEAQKTLLEEIEKAPADADLKYLLGNAYRKQSDWKRALECYNEAIQLDPDSPAVHARQMLNSILEYYCKDIYNP